MLDTGVCVFAPAVWLWGVGADGADFFEGFVLAFAGWLCQLALHDLYTVYSILAILPWVKIIG